MAKDEIQVAKQSERMLEGTLKQKVNSFKDHINRKEGDVSLKLATAKATVKKYGSKRAGTDKAYMRSLAIRMSRHGFIQHFGVDTVRSGGTRTRNGTTYGFKSHVFKMKPQPFINDAVDRSGVVPFVMEEITKIRSEEIIFEVKKIIENK
ncbi:hypothetical protein [Epilithonimonas hominis]|uniref:hypothetical protein n=1 Tax=Epilithonimonas hominis TaxID=420404 RepID=UPI00289D2F48|nr:hypothetical protein [Epilithonimonas hominis]